jgi:hypothetical protein
MLTSLRAASTYFFVKRGNFMPSTPYETFKTQQLQQASTKRLYGHLIENPPQPRIAAAASAKWVLLSPCLCVWDSPESSCPCKGGVLYWMRESDIQASGDALRQTRDGKRLYYLDVNKSAQIVLEVTAGAQIGALPSDRKEAVQKLMVLSRLLKRQKPNLAVDGGTSPVPPSPIAFGISDIWEGLGELLGSADEWWHSFEWSGGDLEGLSTILTAILILL